MWKAICKRGNKIESTSFFKNQKVGELIEK